MNDDHAATKALPDDLLAYMRSHIKAKRDDLDGFLAIGNEVNRAATYERWLAALSAPAAPVAQPLTDEHASSLWQKHLRVSEIDGHSIHGGVDLVRAIERAHGISQGGGAA